MKNKIKALVIATLIFLIAGLALLNGFLLVITQKMITLMKFLVVKLEDLKKEDVGQQETSLLTASKNKQSYAKLYPDIILNKTELRKLNFPSFAPLCLPSGVLIYPDLTTSIEKKIVLALPPASLVEEKETVDISPTEIEIPALGNQPARFVPLDENAQEYKTAKKQLVRAMDDENRKRKGSFEKYKKAHLATLVKMWSDRANKQ